MRFLWLLLILFFVQPSYAQEDWTKSITPEIVLKAMKVYRADPSSKDALGALSIAVNFANQSKDVTIQVQKEVFPFELGSIKDDAEHRFIGAYVAGNLEHQLKTQTNRNSPLAGVTLVLYTYQRLVQKGQFEKLESFERWLSWEKEGVLEQKLGL